MHKLIVLFFIALSFAANADIEGSYEHSKEKYPEITKLLNENNIHEDYSLVNISMQNDGIYSLGVSNNTELLLVNYITFNRATTHYGSVLIKKTGNSFEYSDIDIPNPSEIDYKGSTYSLHKPNTEIKDGALFVSYWFTCKLPAEFITVGDCSDNDVYETVLQYEFQNGKLALVKTEIKI